MASCSLGASDVKMSSLGFAIARIGIVQPQYGMNWPCQRPPQLTGLLLSRKAKNTLIKCSNSSAEAKTAKHLEDGYEETKSSSSTGPIIPSSAEVEYIISEICDTTSVAEFELNLDGFQLHVTRDLTSKIKPPQSAELVSSDIKAEAPSLNGSVSTPSAISISISKPIPSSDNIQMFLDRAADDGLVIIKSQRVGIFKRFRTRKKKKFPPACVENQTVKEGRIIGFIQQMATLTPIKTNVAGQVIRILKEHDEPIGYGDPVIAILPSFPGIKKLLK